MKPSQTHLQPRLWLVTCTRGRPGSSSISRAKTREPLHIDCTPLLLSRGDFRIAVALVIVALAIQGSQILATLTAMAIINGIPGLKVTVKVEDQTAKEYDDPEMDDDDEQNNDDLHIVKPGLPRPHVVKYIEAKTDAAFAFSITRTPDFKHLADHVFFKVVVDGQRDKHIQSDHKSGKQITWHGKVNSLYSRDSNGNNYEHKFKFGNINVG